MEFDGTPLARASDKALTGLRRDAIGFVFQQFNLIPTLTAVENVAIAMARPDRAKALALLETVGLADRAEHLPSRLSGGEQQRVAIARAPANGPRVVLADEPTGNLDSTTAQEIVELLIGLNADQGVTVVVVTHDDEVASQMRRRVRLRSGKIVSDHRRVTLSDGRGGTSCVARRTRSGGSRAAAAGCRAGRPGG